MATRIIPEGGKYRLARDIVIPKGTELKLEPPQKRETYTPHVSFALEIKGHESYVDVFIDVNDGIMSGIVEELVRKEKEPEVPDMEKPAAAHDH